MSTELGVVRCDILLPGDLLTKTDVENLNWEMALFRNPEGKFERLTEDLLFDFTEELPEEPGTYPPSISPERNTHRVKNEIRVFSVEMVVELAGVRCVSGVQCDVDAIGSGDVFGEDLLTFNDIVEVLQQTYEGKSKTLSQHVEFVGVWSFTVTQSGGYFDPIEHDTESIFLGRLDWGSIKFIPHDIPAPNPESSILG